MIHVQHLLGVGHLQRAVRLAEALTSTGYDVVVASGGMPSAQLPDGVKLVQLPPVRSKDGNFDTLLDETNRPIDDNWRQSRRESLLSLFDQFQPHILITETFPFGRRMLRFELLPLIKAAKDHPACTLIVSSIRDVLQPKTTPGRKQETVDLVNNFYDRVIVHGDARICRLEDSFDAADQIGNKISYSGYIARTEANLTEQDSGEVLVSAGGSDRGFAILNQSIAARPLSRLAKHPWRILVSHAIDEDRFAELSNQSTKGIVVERNREEFPKLLAAAHLSVSQAGYNTMTDLLASSTPAVVVPYAEAGELEQAIRAERLQQKGRVILLSEQELSAKSLARSIDMALELQSVLEIDLDGATRSANLIRDWHTESTGKEPCPGR